MKEKVVTFRVADIGFSKEINTEEIIDMLPSKNFSIVLKNYNCK